MSVAWKCKFCGHENRGGALACAECDHFGKPELAQWVCEAVERIGELETSVADNAAA